MSLPREILDQLLSGYLDGALSADERSRVEALLRSDPQVAQELEALRQLRASLRELYRAGAKPLGEKFADRVIESAVTQARAEGLGDDHPVVRLAEQPSTATGSGSSSKRRVASVIIALAALIALAVVLVLPLQQNGDDAPLAEGDSRIAAQGDGAGDAEVAPETTEPEPIETAEQQPEPVLAAGQEQDPGAIIGSLENAAPSSQFADDPSVPRDGQRPEQPSQGPSSEMIADAGSPTAEPIRPDSEEPREEAAPDAPAPRLGAILVLQVRRTDQGRASRAIRAAMRAASIEAASQKQISDQVASMVAESVDAAEDTGGSIVYLQAPAKQIDQFFLHLVGDRAGIESVAMSLVTDAPVLDMVQSLHAVDPTEVRHETAWQLQATDQRAIGALSQRLADREFIPLDETTAAMGITSAAPGSQGADVMSQVLVLIR